MKNGDRFTLRKLLSVFTSSIVRLKELTDVLDQNAETDRKLGADANRVNVVLRVGRDTPVHQNTKASVSRNVLTGLQDHQAGAIRGKQ